MNCISSPSMEDWKLISYIDGEAENSVAAHIEECKYCREKVDRWQKLQARMRTQMYRRACPSPMELGEYHLDLLPPPQKLVVTQHLRECPVCRREVAQLEEFMRELTPQPDIIQSIKVLIAKLISGGRENQTGSSLSPSFAGLRGGDDEPFIYQADHIQIAIEVQEDVEHPGYKALMGLITGLKSNGFIMEAYQEGKIVTTTFVDEIGNFIFSQFLPGTYDLILLGPDTEIRIKSFIV